MPVTIQRMLHGTYHLRIDSGEFILKAGDVAVIADRAIADGIVERSPVSQDKRNEAEELKQTRKFFTRDRGFLGGESYRVTLYVETGLTLIGAAFIAVATGSRRFPTTWREWVTMILGICVVMHMFHLAHTHFEADLRSDGL